MVPTVRVAMGAVAIALVGFLVKGALPRPKARVLMLTRRVVRHA
jgi:hypothetical protein